MTVYIVIGTRQEVSQKYIGGSFEASYHKKMIMGFKSMELALKYIESKKLKTPIKNGSFSGTSYYKDGYYDMDVETVEIED